MRNRTQRQITDQGELRNYSFDLLARQEYSREQLRRKLASRCEDSDLIDTVLDDLAERGYQSDRRFAEIQIRSRLSQGQGARKISFELARKGVASATIDQLLAEQQIDMNQLALEYLRRRYGTEPAGDQKEKARRVRHLVGRGFEFDAINYALRHQSDDD